MAQVPAVLAPKPFELVDGTALVGQPFEPQPITIYVGADNLIDVLANGGVTPQAAIADISTANATDLATAQALANATKTKVNQILAALRSAGIIAN